MNVGVLGRIRPPITGESVPSLHITDENTLSAGQQTGAIFHRFQTLFDHTTNTQAVYHDTVVPMLDNVIAGFNCSLVCFGDSGSGKTYTLVGEESTNIDGIVQMTIKDLFDKIGYGASTSSGFTNSIIKLSLHELYNETIKDLLKGDEGNMMLDVTAEKGLHVKNLTSIQVSSESDALAALKKGLACRNTTQTDYGPAEIRATMFITLMLTLEKPQDPSYPYQSAFTFIDLPGAEKLTVDSQKLRKREGMLLNKSLLSLGPLIDQLANKRCPDRVIDYSDSQLTKQLDDIMGGNCLTNILIHFKPQTTKQTLDVSLTMARHMTQVINYPVSNDANTQGLLTQYRAKIIYLQRQLGQSSVEPALNTEELQENHAKLARENLKLKEEKRYLERKMEQIQSRLEDSAGSKSDLSAKLIASEEERLKVSKTLVDLKIENNRLKEKSAQETFELSNKLMSLDSEFSHVEVERSRLAKENAQMHQRLRYLETDKGDVDEKYVQLNADYRTLVRKYDQEVSRNQELGLELLNLLHARVTLLKQQDNLAKADMDGKSTPSPGELSRVRDIALVMSTNNKKAEDIGSTEMERLDIEKKIFGNQERFKREMEGLKSQYDEQQEILKARISGLTSSVKKSMETARSAQQKLAQQEVEVIMLRDKAKSIQTLNGQLQLQLKEKNSELKSKLIKYVQDIAEYVDARSTTLNRPMEQQLTDYVKEMVKDLKNTYTSREKQLSDAVKEYRSQSQMVAKKHEQLMVAYRLLQMKQQNLPSSSHGEQQGEQSVEELEFSLADEELDSANRQEINRLQNKLKELQHDQNRGGKRCESWTDLEAQLQEFTQNTQKDLESERATLMSSNAILEEQLAECRRYIDTQLKKHKDEISRLRSQLGHGPSDGYTDRMNRRDHRYRGHSPDKARYY